MRIDNLQQYVNLRRELTQERDQLSRRLNQINEAIGDLSSASNEPAQEAPVMGTQDTVKTIESSMSPAARARIAEAQRQRWAATRKAQGGNGASAQKKAAPSSGKRMMSAAGRKAIAEAARKRWAAAKRAGKNRL
jgi:hypothetical protein